MSPILYIPHLALIRCTQTLVFVCIKSKRKSNQSWNYYLSTDLQAGMKPKPMRCRSRCLWNLRDPPFSRLSILFRGTEEKNCLWRHRGGVFYLRCFSCATVCGQPSRNMRIPRWARPGLPKASLSLACQNKCLRTKCAMSHEPPVD